MWSACVQQGSIVLNIRLVIQQLGLLLVLLCLALLGVTTWGAVEQIRGEAVIDPNGIPIDREWVGLLAEWGAVAVGLVLGGLMWWFGRPRDRRAGMLGRREALLLVGLGWLLGAAVAGLPYFLWAHLEEAAGADHPFRSFTACYFEAMSGLTTTGATVLSDIRALPFDLLLWRATTHWLGGLGIVVLFVAVLPTLGVGGKKLYQVEAPGPAAQGVRPRIRETARLLWIIYLGMTVAEVVLLRLAGMELGDAVCHTFATLATGGFSTRDASVGYYDSALINWILIAFMLLAGANFGLYYQLLRRRFHSVWTDPELRVYLGIVLVGCVIVCGALVEERMVSTTGADVEPSIAAAIRHGVFQVVSIQTTTGFATADFDLWGMVPKMTLLFLMFVGASAGSTGGGIKIIRVLIAFKVMLAEVERIFRPNVVRTVKVGRQRVDPELRLGTMVYIMGILLLFALGTIALMIIEADQGIDVVTAVSASAATLNNVGPGLNLVGAVRNYGWFSEPSLVVMSLLMALGRLEMYAIVVMFVPRFWKSE